MSRGFSFDESRTLECPLLALRDIRGTAIFCPLSDKSGQNKQAKKISAANAP